MKIKRKLAQAALENHKSTAWGLAGVCVLIILLAGLPSVIPGGFGPLNEIKIDTDPENMLPEDEPVRVFHDRMKEEFSLYDMVVVGVVNEEHEHGVFNPETLENINEISDFAKTLQWEEEDGEMGGVVAVDMIAPSTVDNIEQGSLGSIKLEWLMPEPPQTQEEALAVRDKALDIPFFKGTMVSEDGKAIALYLPLTSKDYSYQVSQALRDKIAEIGGQEDYHITGLPVAEDTFGVEMFIQMAISAPTAMVIIFLLMLVFFRKLVLIISPMIVAIASVIFTMGLLIISGFPIHIMSSMIPIFIMPIAVLDSVHIISEFFELYQETRDRRETILKVMDELFKPMLYTSLTSAAGFASLALTPIPPVQVFGVFVAIGIMFAWFLTMTFIPAYVMFIKPEKLEEFGKKSTGDEQKDNTPIGRFLHAVGGLTYRWAKPILAGAVVVFAVAVYGISQININDNPVKWFTESHPIRVADRVLNDHFGGTYMAYLTMEAPEDEYEPAEAREQFINRLDEFTQQYSDDEELQKAAEIVSGTVEGVFSDADSKAVALEQLSERVDELAKKNEDISMFVWDDLGRVIDQAAQELHVFKQPEVLEYQEKLQRALGDMGKVGKSNSLADIIKTVHRELFGEEEKFAVPDEPRMIAECMLQYQSGHRPGDLWHFVTPDYRKSVLWLQLTSGDNEDMTKVVKAVDEFVEKNPPPAGVETDWFGLTYINVIWQDKMVKGMVGAFVCSFLVVLLMMTTLFRSSLWGLLCMVPLTVTILLIYGVVGLVGKDYDMPVAVLSSLTLGLAVDFAIHFLARSQDMYRRYGSWKETVPAVFAEPARAITRNIIVIAVGFLPLLLAPLTPYKTVGMLLATILLVSGAATMLLLPALMRVFEDKLFASKPAVSAGCNCAACLLSSVTLVTLIAMTLHQYADVGWGSLTWLAVVVIPLTALLCGRISRREKCESGNDIFNAQNNKKGA
ncbi:efflux transporter, putative, hydrophobe/amphiphile efflux-3 (HAE3) family [Anaerohalosphaera lusitana]|uniref:Efflux transporter, putative, hydrophobe/amphiphile efflux-3 (HAE3) family n=1 Tax=Anaerohalosphaera lusitana TaxID=1936003 RepID=A0A1U9NNI0_9BACT|nr:MMPL family transporter [Anaerohalosphaera lusitana]AQT69170.1 efflux transporter, putative, hydrophobe/amphiphile efflux-3 (HAE3) family [Anaerohalosphaera lusitana]